MTYFEYKFLIFSDLYRVTGSVKIADLIFEVCFGDGFRYCFWMRTCRFARGHPFLKYTLYIFSRLMLRRVSYRLGIKIPFLAEVGSGLYIGHFGGIVVNAKSVIGKNCNISQGVTLGQANRGKKKGYPTLGDNVYIGPGAKIIGAVTIGNNVAIGANCVVTKDIPDDSVVVGIPGQVISSDGSSGYIDRTDYEIKIRGCRHKRPCQTDTR